MRRIVNFLSGALLGGLIASALVLLLTPSSGSSIRKQIAELANKTYEEVRQAGEQRRDELQLELQELRAPKE
ncbi:MAG: YtxH domain-containing protein [Anaerolineaceae bacterium]|nr:YtxH domain-containing protein [Anaerolineaceae bacterium]